MPVSPPVHYAPLPHEVWFAYLALRLRFKKGVTADPPKQFIKACLNLGGRAFQRQGAFLAPSCVAVLGGLFPGGLDGECDLHDATAWAWASAGASGWGVESSANVI